VGVLGFDASALDSDTGWSYVDRLLHFKQQACGGSVRGVSFYRPEHTPRCRLLNIRPLWRRRIAINGEDEWVHAVADFLLNSPNKIFLRPLRRALSVNEQGRKGSQWRADQRDRSGPLLQRE
jgi:hypothetical protein